MTITCAGDTGIYAKGLSGTAVGTDVQPYSDVLTSYSTNGSFGFKNKIIGGDFSINPWSRGTSFSFSTSGQQLSTADRFIVDNYTDGSLNVLKTADAPSIAEAGLFTQHCLHLDVLTADTSLSNTQFVGIRHYIDGYTLASFGFGQTGTRYITLSFWVKSTKTGIFCVSFRNNLGTRSYVSEYTVNSSDTWEKKIITIPVDNLGTWSYDSGIGVQIFWTVAMVYDTRITTTPNTWENSPNLYTSNQVNGIDSNTNNFKLALIQLEAGSIVTPFETRNADIERLLCGIPVDNIYFPGTLKNTYLQAEGAFTFRNKIIGGDFTTNPWQRGVSASVTTGNAIYLADRFIVNNTTDGVVSVLKTADAPSVSEAGIFTQHCLHVDVTTADTSIGGTQYCLIGHIIEGYNIANMGFGQPGTRYFTLSFWVKSTKTGIFCVTFRNQPATRTYSTEYTINVSNTWEKKIITVPVDTTGTWYYDYNRGLDILFGIANGTTTQSTPWSWYAGNSHSTVNQVNGMDSTSNDFKLALVQLEAGPVATPFETRSYGTELALCQRYYERCGAAAGTTYPNDTVLSARTYNTGAATTNVFHTGFMKVPKRVTPTGFAFRYSTSGGAKADGGLGILNKTTYGYSIGLTTGAYIDMHDWYAYAEY